jgi:hypothetical protein
LNRIKIYRDLILEYEYSKYRFESGDLNIDDRFKVIECLWICL